MKNFTKRKMHYKRHKKEKAEHLKQPSLPTAAAHYAANKATTCKSNNFNTVNRKQCQQYENYKNNQSAYQIINPLTSYSQSLQMWWQTYCSAIEFHTQQQRTWQNESNPMAEQQMTLFEKYANEYETSSDEEQEDNYDEIEQETLDDDKVSIDEGYLKFMEITLKHREELRLQRAQENI